MPRPAAVKGETLSSVDAFRSLGVAARNEIAALCEGAIFESGESVVSRSEPGTAVYFIVSGAVDVTVYGESGRSTRFITQQAGEMFGELAAVDEQPRSADIRCVAETFLLTIGARDFREVLHRHQSVNDFVLRHLAGMVRRLSQQVHELNVLSARQRLCAELARLAGAGEKGRGVIEHPPTQAALAAKIGTHRELVSRELKQLVDKGILAKGDRHITVMDFDRLRSLAGVNELYATD